MNIRLGTAEDKYIILNKYPHTSQVMYEGGNLLIADKEEAIIGFLWSFRRNIPAPIKKMEEFINVIEIFSDTDRCIGIGSLLVQKCIEIAKENGCYQVRAYCDVNNIPTHMLWVKNGFTISPIKLEDDSIPDSYVSYKL